MVTAVRKPPRKPPKVIAYARYDFTGHRMELRTSPALGFKGLVWEDAMPAPVYDKETIERKARELGWSPPIDQQQLMLNALADKNLGVSFETLCTLIGRSVRTVKAIAQPLRLQGKVRIYPKKGPGAVWYLAEHEATVIGHFFEIQAAQNRAMNERRKQAKLRKMEVDRHVKMATAPDQIPLKSLCEYNSQPLETQ